MAHGVSVQLMCAQEITELLGDTAMQSCVLNNCFGSNEHVLKMAKGLGI